MNVEEVRIWKVVTYLKILTGYSPGETKINLVKSPDRRAGNSSEIKSGNTSLERYCYTNLLCPNSCSPGIGSELMFMAKSDEYGN
jgi:hypothetical protein